MELEEQGGGRRSRIRYASDLAGVDWASLKRDLKADRFDNGRTPEELRTSFANSQHVMLAWSRDRVVGMARLLADGVCNAYLVDVWTESSFRGQGIGREMVSRLLGYVPGHHVALFTDSAVGLYERLGFRREEHGMSIVVGQWLNRPP